MIGNQDKLDEIIEAVRSISEKLTSIEGRLDGMDKRLDGMDIAVNRIQRQMVDFETTLYGMRTLGNCSGYRPERERIEGSNAASIQPVNAWRRRPG
jgi:hypothetical protein